MERLQSKLRKNWLRWIEAKCQFWFAMPGYAGMSTDSPEVIEEVVLYGRIVCTLSIGPYEKWVNFP